MRKIISISLFLALFSIMTVFSEACAQDINLPREVAEYYYEQKKENDKRKEIIISKDSLIVKQVKKIELQDSLIEEKDKEIDMWESSNRLLDQIIVSLEDNLDEEQKKVVKWKVKTILIAVGLVLLVII